MLVASRAQIEDFSRQLMRIGIDSMLGYVEDVNTLGIELETVNLIDTQTIETLVSRNDVQLVDLRGAAEYKAGHIDGAESVFVGTLPAHLDKISRDKTVIIYCQGGDRATIGYSLLIRHGFKTVKNYSGGMNEWVKNLKLEPAG
ncbi:hydroxyacylglutathione hydrolase [Larkinella arboricola]|uniref:Hydroxyacylglutathione hydrolase n=1 Tax=Larkinella arboricola TaxID=643671 RepID=A0A327WLP9_LARAB|nr:hydroxyacylglutathione hydrolase [Larkinella arboricola]